MSGDAAAGILCFVCPWNTAFLRLSWAIALVQCGGVTAKHADTDSAAGAATSTGGAGSGAVEIGPGGSAGAPIIVDPTLELPDFCHDEIVSDSVYCQGDGPPRTWAVYDAATANCLTVEVNRCLTMAFGSMAMCEVYCVSRASSRDCPSENVGLLGESCDVEGSACVYARGGCLCTTLSDETCGAIDPSCTIEPVGGDSGSNDPTICECRDGSWLCYSYGSYAF